ncbi:MAG: PorT family protein [Bacteroidaceae bacterium]|nr:PorT family protein [Bacteroidaceae bacterium]
MKKIVLVILLLGIFVPKASAQWRAGVYGGIDWGKRSINPGYSYAFARSAAVGGVAGVSGQYIFNEWLGIRTDLNAQWRNYNDCYSIMSEYYRYRNMYLTLPVMASFSFGGKKVRGYLGTGVYAGLWCAQNIYSREMHNGKPDFRHTASGFSKADKRFDAGLAGCLGVTCMLTADLSVNVEGMLYYGLVNSHNTGSSRYVQPSYFTTPCINMGLAWVFDK